MNSNDMYREHNDDAASDVWLMERTALTRLPEGLIILATNMISDNALEFIGQLGDSVMYYVIRENEIFSANITFSVVLGEPDEETGQRTIQFVGPFPRPPPIAEPRCGSGGKSEAD
jgi:hypothetical protein